ncbi:octopamine receptor beta-2R-like [Oculina patagonica]
METWFWILGWFLSILTITGNGFIIFLVCNKRQLRTKTNAFIVSLAVADFCVGMSVVPSLFVCEMASGCSSQSRLSDGISLIRNLFGFASVMNLCSLVLDRYIAVVKPLTYLTFMKRRRVIQMVSLAWAVPFSFIVVFLLNWLILKISLLFRIFICIAMIFFEFLPCSMLIFCFASMLRIVCKHDRAARTLAKQLRFNHQVLFKNQEKSAILMMAIVIGLFLLCYAFYLRCSFVLIFSDHKPCNDLKVKIPLVVLNSAINPVAYAFFKRDIKKEIKRRNCCVIGKQRNKIEPANEGNCFILEN